MKKVLSLLIAVVLALSFCQGIAINDRANAQNLSYLAFSTYQEQVLSEFSEFKNRQNGSEGELAAANFIKTELDDIRNEHTNLVAENSASIVDGLQTFRFNSVFDGNDYYSQNIIYTLNSQTETSKKVIIATNYDSFAMDIVDGEIKFVESEGINTSAASVSLLLSLAKFLPSLNLDFNVEFVFFGAGESNNSGSRHYIKGISEEEKNDVLCMINLDNLAVGENLYYYVDEIDTNFSDYLGSCVENLEISKVNLLHLGKDLLDYQNELGLDYYHIALNSDNINFMSQNITSINFFAGDYEEGIIYGRNEYSDKDLVSYTKNDNLSFIAENYGENLVFQNLFNVCLGITNLLTSENFVSECINSQNSTKLFYDVFGNKEVITYLTAVALVIIIAIIIGIHFKFTLKSYDAKIEPEFLSTIISISQNIDETCADENVPKAVSQVVANDIKKDKIIKSKKKDS